MADSGIQNASPYYEDYEATVGGKRRTRTVQMLNTVRGTFACVCGRKFDVLPTDEERYCSRCGALWTRAGTAERVSALTDEQLRAIKAAADRLDEHGCVSTEAQLLSAFGVTSSQLDAVSPPKLEDRIAVILRRVATPEHGPINDADAHIAREILLDYRDPFAVQRWA